MPRIVKSHDVRLDDEYSEWMREVKRRYRSAQSKAAVKVNSEQLLFNWQLGRDLVLRKAEERWGSGEARPAPAWLRGWGATAPRALASARTRAAAVVMQYTGLFEVYGNEHGHDAP